MFYCFVTKCGFIKCIVMVLNEMKFAIVMFQFVLFLTVAIATDYTTSACGSSNTCVY